jgi:transcriptional regulator with XRE-family HTH domain
MTLVTISELNKILQRHKDSPAGIGHELRLNLSEIVLQNLQRQQWTQRKLATAAGKCEAYITRIVHGQQNCSLDTVGQILFALGVRAQLTQTTPIPTSTFEGLKLTPLHAEETYGDEEEISYHQESAQEEDVHIITCQATQSLRITTNPDQRSTCVG